MIKYARVMNEETGICEVGLGIDIAYYEEIGMTLQDVEESEINGRWYLKEKCPHYTDAEKLEQAKQEKIAENDTVRDAALNQGVAYQNILFDSDTDQKVNLLATVSLMDDTDTIEWFGMNNDSLVCNKADLINIGGLITQLHKFCWNKNAEIKDAISKAESIEELERININYDFSISG